MLVYSLTPSVTSEQKRSSALEQRSTPSRFQSAVRIYTTELSLVKDWAKLTVDDKTSSLKRKTSELRKISNVRSNFVLLLVMSRGFEVVTGAKALRVVVGIMDTYQPHHHLLLFLFLSAMLGMELRLCSLRQCTTTKLPVPCTRFFSSLGSSVETE